MNYGFLIDNRRCIGCHACSTACKSENQVPLGVSRTWVKYTEVGTYPDVKRHFQVTRCNHCENPPCVRICPVSAMYQRQDGIVEFDANVCIGCKACMQACPYDAIYIDPETKSAAKCHFCSHRVEIGLEPACVIVCPEHAIIAGDLDDANSEITKVLAENSVGVRKPEQGTRPKLFYINGHSASLNAANVYPQKHSYMWSENKNAKTQNFWSFANIKNKINQRKSYSGQNIRSPESQNSAESYASGRKAEQMVQVSYSASHKIPWHWQVPAYLVTKGIAAGIVFFLICTHLSGWVLSYGSDLAINLGVSLLFTLLTTLFLVFDLEHPKRFLRILTRAQMKSWLCRGAFILIAFTMVVGAWSLFEVSNVITAYPGYVFRDIFSWLTLPLAIGTAIYTAFLFGQAEGRDFWQSPLLPIRFFLQSLLLGTACILFLNYFIPFSVRFLAAATEMFLWSALFSLICIFLTEFGMPLSTPQAVKASHQLIYGDYKYHFWLGGLFCGHIFPLLFFVFIDAKANLLMSFMGLLCLFGIYLYEYAFVMAPQKILS
ncbi:MAG: NrfD/PsrC family molybdoenzyme membrane anchor subunit [Bdellovibrionota bacterium]